MATTISCQVAYIESESLDQLDIAIAILHMPALAEIGMVLFRPGLGGKRKKPIVR